MWFTHRQSAAGDAAVSCDDVGTIECDFGLRTTGASGGAAMSCDEDADGHIEGEFGSRADCAGGGAPWRV
jgi:hypothetical protein